MRRKSLFLAVLFLVALVGLFNSPLFELEEVAVEGNYRVPETEIVDRLKAQESPNILKLNLKEKERRLEEKAWIRRARISRKLPAMLSVVVEEYDPAAYLRQEEGFVVLSRSGDVIEKKRELGHYNLPLISGFAGGDDNGIARRVRWLVGMLGQLEDDFLQRVSELTYEEGGGLTLYTVEGVPCFLGDSEEELSAAFALLPPLWAEFEKKGLEPEYIDITAPDKPVVGRKPGNADDVAGD